MLDNTLEEESVMSGSISVWANIFGEIIYMQMNIDIQVSLEYMNKIIGEMEKYVDFIHKTIIKFMEKENKRVDNIIKEMIIIEKKEEMNEDENNNNEVHKKKIIELIENEEKT